MSGIAREVMWQSEDAPDITRRRDEVFTKFDVGFTRDQMQVEYNTCLRCGLSGDSADDLCICGGIVLHYSLPVSVDEVA